MPNFLVFDGDPTSLAAVKAQRLTESGEAAPAIIHFSPTGRRIDQALVQELAAGEKVFRIKRMRPCEGQLG